MAIKMLHVVMISGGLSSAFTLSYVLKRYGKENTVALFTDTLWEDEDNYRFIHQLVDYFKVNYEYRKDGRTPPEVWFKTRFLVGKSFSKCSLELKTNQTQKYIKEIKAKGIEPVLYFGIDKQEEHRAVNIAYRYAPIECRFPLVETPLTNEHMKAVCEVEWGIAIPRMYRMGFSHANCGGRCIKGGQGHFKRLYEVWPDRYSEVEHIERQFREKINPKIAILKDRRGGKINYMTLKDFRKRFSSSTIFTETEDDATPCECMY